MKTLFLSLFGFFLVSCGSQKQLTAKPGEVAQSEQSLHGPQTQKQATIKKPLPPNTASNKYSAKRQKRNGSKL